MAIHNSGQVDNGDGVLNDRNQNENMNYHRGGNDGDGAVVTSKAALLMAVVMTNAAAILMQVAASVCPIVPALKIAGPGLPAVM